MKSIIFSVIILSAFSLSVSSQVKEPTRVKFGIGGLAGFNQSSVFGIDLQGEICISPLFVLTLSIGYLDGENINSSRKSGEIEHSKSGLIPVLAGLKYYFSSKIYGSAQSGLSYFLNDTGIGTGHGNAVTFAPGLGYKISEKFDVMLKYQAALNGKGSFVGLRAGLTF